MSPYLPVTSDRLARAGGLVGLVMGIVYAVWLVLEQSVPGRAGTVPALALGLGYVVPFLMALAVRRVHEPSRRVAIWLGCGVLGLLLSMTSLAGATLPLLVPSGLLLAAAWKLHRARPGRRGGAEAAVVMGIITLGTASVLVVRVLADGYGAAFAVLGWTLVGAWVLAMLSMDRRRDLGVRP